MGTKCQLLSGPLQHAVSSWRGTMPVKIGGKRLQIRVRVQWPRGPGEMSRKLATAHPGLTRSLAVPPGLESDGLLLTPRAQASLR